MKQTDFTRWAKGVAGVVSSITCICFVFIQLQYCWWPAAIFCGFLLYGSIVSTVEAVTGRLYTKDTGR
jgi:hypothetical protein